jgi:hypothetical protein
MLSLPGGWDLALQGVTRHRIDPPEGSILQMKETKLRYALAMYNRVNRSTMIRNEADEGQKD